MKTFSTRLSDIRPMWHVIDADGRTLGRLATEVSVLLQGKHKPLYARHLLTGDFVIIINASKINVTGNKMSQKLYRRHSHYPSGLTETPLWRLQQKFPDRVIRAAVRGMLPSTTLGRHMLRRLKVYAGDSHPHQAQVSAPVAEVKTEGLVVRPKPTRVRRVKPEVDENLVLQTNGGPTGIDDSAVEVNNQAGESGSLQEVEPEVQKDLEDVTTEIQDVDDGERKND